MPAAGCVTRLSGLLGAGIAAAVAGARSFAAVAEWAADQDASMLAALGLDRPCPPAEATFRRVFTGLDPDVLDGVLGAWFWARTGSVAGRRVIAIDGKTVRGARSRDADGTSAPHLVAAFDHAAGRSWARSRSPRRATRSLRCERFWVSWTSPGRS